MALVNMPWARLDAPSIQCGLLQSIVREHGHTCDVHYLNVELAALLGHDLYDGLSDVHAERLHLLGEWLFSFAAFGEVTRESEYFAEYPEIEATWSGLSGGGMEELVALRRDVLPGWLAESVEGIDWDSYDVVGFSSTFLQNTASLALGRLLKERFPSLVLVYGGANFDGEMGTEYLRGLPWLDHVVTGEGDIALPRLLASIADGTATADSAATADGAATVDGAPLTIPGVHTQSRGAPPPASDSPRLSALDGLPHPDYRDYFEAIGRHDRERVLGRTPVKLPIEFSRGCWWGEKHHCTFCGLNALGMGYRAKSAERALDELAGLLRDYPAVHVEAVDNILDMKYISSLVPELAARHWDVHIFFEVKANLTREQLAGLRSAGIMRIQPGIESLSSAVLDLMRKGSSKLLNIRLLKWAGYYGIGVAWNLLTGFPGETDDDYRRQAELMPLLHHLEPPGGAGRIWLERFSPYFTDDASPLADARPRSSYRHIYPAHLDHSKIAYFFDYTAADIGSDRAFQELSDAAAQWRKRWAEGRPRLIYQRLPGKLVLIDSRSGPPRRATLQDWHADAYEACGDAPRSAARVRETLARSGPALSTDEVAAFLDRCCRSRVMVSDEGKYLSLALPENPGW
ncbi:RiPP maturation radical SAM C-methyltransferase [Streptomyces sp. NBC_00440]|uniref:RiPP maturation radical SAM C-methyltransferase n=1 Tax=Streptomyces sp. NBC_00440 TaxID=2975741 RepID=UPI002E247E54